MVESYGVKRKMNAWQCCTLSVFMKILQKLAYLVVYGDKFLNYTSGFWGVLYVGVMNLKNIWGTRPCDLAGAAFDIGVAPNCEQGHLHVWWWWCVQATSSACTV